MSAWWSPLQETGIDGWNIRTHVWEQRLRTIRFLARPTDRHRDYDRGVGVRGRGRSDPSGGGATRLARRQWNASHRRDAQGCEPAARRHHRHRDWRGRADLRGGGRWVQLKDALNAVWEVEKPPGSGLWRFVRTYIWSLAGVLSLGFLLLVSMLLTAALSAAGKYVAPYLPEAMLQIAGLLASFAVISVLFAMMFKWLPD